MKNLKVFTLSLIAFFASSQEVEEIIVSAEKTEKNILDVTTTLNLYEEDFLDSQEITELGQLGYYVPNLTVQEQEVAYPSFSMRGIGNDSGYLTFRIGRFMNGQSMGTTTMSSFALFDIDRIEILKGPQPTTFGVDASAGAINVVTNKAELGETYGSVAMGFGDFNRNYLETTHNFAISDSSAFRVSTYYVDVEGYTENLSGRDVNGRGNAKALRLSYTNDFTDRLSTDVVFYHEHNDSPGVGFKNTFIPSPLDSENSVYGPVDFRNDRETNTKRYLDTYQLLIDYILTDNSSLSLNIQNASTATDNYFEADGSFIQLFSALNNRNDELESFEIQYNYNADNLSFFVGFNEQSRAAYDEYEFYFDEGYLMSFLQVDGFFSAQYGLPGVFGLGGASVFASTKIFDPSLDLLAARTAYGQAILGNYVAFPVPLYTENRFDIADEEASSVYFNGSLRVNEDLTLTLGYRESETESFALQRVPDCPRPLLLGFCQTPSYELSNNFSDDGKGLFKYGANYSYSDEISFYANYSEGRVNPVVAFSAVTPAEEVETLDVGFVMVSSNAFLSGAIYTYDFMNYSVVRQNYASGQTELDIMDTATIQGFELYGSYNFDENTKVFGSFGNNDAELGNNTTSGESFDYAGNKWRLAPEYSYSIGLDFMLDKVNTILAYTYQDDMYAEESNDPFTFIEGYGLVNLNLSYSMDQYNVSAFAKNLLDEKYLIDIGNTGGTIIGTPTVIQGSPLTLGVSVSFNY